MAAVPMAVSCLLRRKILRGFKRKWQVLLGMLSLAIISKFIKYLRSRRRRRRVRGMVEVEEVIA